MSEQHSVGNPTISEKERNQIDKILSFATNRTGMPTPRPDPNNKTITTSIVQGGVRRTSTRLKPVRKLTPTEELDRVLSLGFPNA